jgi:hypothetical protein
LFYSCNKITILDHQSIVRTAGDADHFRKNDKLKLRTVELTGRHHKFQLELLLFINMGKVNIRLGLCAVHKIFEKGNRMILPLYALPWLRNQMAEMLIQHDGTEEIEEVSAQIPRKFLHMGGYYIFY